LITLSPIEHEHKPQLEPAFLSMSTPHFHALYVKRITPLTGESAAITLAIPPDLRDTFAFIPGQFVTLRAMVNGQAVRRSYSLCSTPAQLASAQEISVGIKRVEGGIFSTWATTALQAGDELDVMPPDGRFTPKTALANAHSMHRLGIAAGSGITPILSIMAHTLATEPNAHFSLVYGNQRSTSIMFSEALQDLKDRYKERVTLTHVLSRQPQEVALFHGRLDEARVSALLAQTVPVGQIAEVFVCGPEAMIEAAQRALAGAGIDPARVHAERFASSAPTGRKAPAAPNTSATSTASKTFSLDVVLDGKTSTFGMDAQDNVLDTALEGGLDLPYACKGGVCCTCRAKVLEGKVTMLKNFTLEQWEIDKGFVLTCQAQCASKHIVISYDER
jgi:ring-1,2-phenylacetyl-CoA epoxidase subunit PaaE